MPIATFVPAFAAALVLASATAVAASPPSAPVVASPVAAVPAAGSADPAPPPLASARQRLAETAAAAGLAGELVVTDAGMEAGTGHGGATGELVLGLADRARHRPHRAGQRWLWASVTKQVAAVLVMQEVERGRLALDAPLGDYLPTFGGDRTITPRQLLQHRSGLPDPDATPARGDEPPAFYRQRGAATGDPARALGYCAGPARATPGGDFYYNNCDYLVLGAVLRAVTGQSFGALVRARLARPLGLSSLRLAADGVARGGAAATGYRGSARYPALNVATFGAAGALTGTARDLAAFDRALLDGRLLGPAARATLWAGEPKLGYEALGAWSYPARLAGCGAPVPLVERRGDVGGTQVRNVLAPTLGRAVVVFTNDAGVEFGEVWQGRGLTYDLLSAALCPATLAVATPPAAVLPVAQAATAPPEAAPGRTQPSPLDGDWTVDLRPTPSAPAYFKPMHLAVAVDGTLTGSFYEHPLENGRGRATNGQPCFAFRTSDASGPYQTSGCLKGPTIEGQTWSEGRHFLLVWTAQRPRAAAP